MPSDSNFQNNKFQLTREALQQKIANSSTIVTPLSDEQRAQGVLDPALTSSPREPTDPANFRPLVLQARQPVQYADDNLATISRRQPEFVEPQPAPIQSAPAARQEPANILPNNGGGRPPSTVIADRPDATMAPPPLPQNLPPATTQPDQSEQRGLLFNPDVTAKAPELAVPQPINHIPEVPRPDETMTPLEVASNQAPPQPLVPKTVEPPVADVTKSANNSMVAPPPQAVAELEPNQVEPRSSDPHDASFARGLLEARRQRQNRDLPLAA